MLYYKIQIMDLRNPKTVKGRANALKRFCRHFDLHPVLSQSFQDTYYIPLPEEDQYLACEMINALDAYCCYHKIASRISFGRVTVPFDEFIKSIDEGYLKDGYKPYQPT